MSGEPTGPWGPAEDASIRSLQYKVETLEKEKQQMQTLLWNLMQEREEARKGRSPTTQEMTDAWQGLLETDLPDNIRIIQELQSQLNYYKEAEVKWQYGGGGSHAAKESLEAARLREEELQEKTSALRRLLKEKEDWIETEKTYRMDLDEFRSRLELAKTASADSDSVADALRTCKEELSRVKKRNDELKQKTETAERRLAVAHGRLEKKEQGAEYSYQRLVEYFELQKGDLSKQLNWMVLRHGKETESYEHELAVKEKRLQAMDAQAQLLRELNPGSDAALKANDTLANTIEEDRLRHELDKARIETEQIKAESDQRHRELLQQNSTLSVEVESHKEKISRLERSCAEKASKITKYQDKIQSLNDQLNNLEDESSRKEATSNAEHTRLRGELQRITEANTTNASNLSEKIKSSEAMYERLRTDYNDTKRNLTIEKEALQGKVEQFQLDIDRLQVNQSLQTTELKKTISSRDKDLIKLKERAVTSETEASRWRQKCDILDKEVKVLSEQITTLLDRDQQLRSEIQVIKIEWNKTELSLKHTEKIKRRMGDENEALRRRLSATSQLVKNSQNHRNDVLPLAISFTSERRSHRRTSPVDTDALWSPT